MVHSLFRSPHGLTPTVTRRSWTLFLVSILFGVASGLGCSQPASNKDMVTLDQARAEHDAGKVVLIDIREPVEHAERVAQGTKRGWPMVKPQ
jgi:hypothetical protein